MKNGYWPSMCCRILYDFLPKKCAPPYDGIREPKFEEPAWVRGIAEDEKALKVVRRAHDEANFSVKITEEKGSRLAHTSLIFLSFAFALGLFILRELLLSRSKMPFSIWWWVIFGAVYLISLLLLVVATFQSLQIDRVGFYYHPKGDEFKGYTGKDFCKKVIEGEEKGRQLAVWTSRHKITDLMQARAWFSRGLAFFVIAIIFLSITLPILRNPTSENVHALSSISRLLI